MSTYNDVSHTSENIKDSINKFYNSRNKLIVNTPAGTMVTASCNGTTFTSTNYSGLHTFYYDQYGIWTITASNSQLQATDTVNIEELKDYTIDMLIVDSDLNKNTWKTIQSVAQQSMGSSYWPIGALKEITLSGTLGTGVGALTFPCPSGTSYPWDSTFYVYIIGFDHNSDIEGTGITFQAFKHNSDYGIVDVAFEDDYYGADNSTYNGIFEMETTAKSAPNWVDSYMRGLCNTGDNSFLSILPYDLKSVIKTCVKKNNYYNSGIYETQDNIFLLANTEVYGHTGGTYDIVGQEQYDYYINQTSALEHIRKYCYRTRNGSISGFPTLYQYKTPIYWWTRSPANGTNAKYSFIVGDGTGTVSGPNQYLGFTPAFLVG